MTISLGIYVISLNIHDSHPSSIEDMMSSAGISPTMSQISFHDPRDGRRLIQDIVSL